MVILCLHRISQKNEARNIALIFPAFFVPALRRDIDSVALLVVGGEGIGHR